MHVQILCDSFCDFTAAERLSSAFEKVPATVTVAGQQFLDDDGFQQAALLPYLKEKGAEPRIQFPDEQAYLAAMHPEAEEIYIVTSSAANVGQYEAASAARRIRMREIPEQNVHVFNTRGGSVGQLLAAREISRLQRSGCDFRQIVTWVERDILTTRIYLLPADIAFLYNMALLPRKKRIGFSKVLCQKKEDGKIQVMSSAMTAQGVEKKLAQVLAKQPPGKKARTCIIAHCGCPERARRVSQILKKGGQFSEFLLAETGAVTSVALGPGGLALAF